MLESLFNKVAKACNFIKKRLQHKCFPANIAKFLKTAFLYRTLLVAVSVGTLERNHQTNGTRKNVPGDKVIFRLHIIKALHTKLILKFPDYILSLK